MSDSALMLASYDCGKVALPVINCRRWRAKDCKATCAARPSGPTLHDCMGCAVRLPIVGRARLRGAGDLVAWLVFLLFLRRLDIAERVGAWLWRRKAPQGKAPQQVKAGGCGCKARKDALNRAIPFGTTNANRLHQHDGFPAGSPGQDHLHGQGSAEPAGKHPHEH